MSHAGTMPAASNFDFDDLLAEGRLVPLGKQVFLHDAESVARELVGCILVADPLTVPVGGVIVETEAYLDARDPGSHAATRRVTQRNRVMYGPPGHAYVYLSYGSHYMLNFVCEPEGVAAAVLIRAIEPLFGVDVMTARREGRALRDLCDGPGKLTRALSIDLADNGRALSGGRLQVYAGLRPESGQLAVSGRIGLSSGYDLALRFFLKDSKYVSRGRPGPLGAPKMGKN